MTTLNQTCGTCKHWSNEAQSASGYCEKIDDFYPLSGMARISSDDWAVLETRADFGCVLWEERKE